MDDQLALSGAVDNDVAILLLADDESLWRKCNNADPYVQSLCRDKRLQPRLERIRTMKMTVPALKAKAKTLGIDVTPRMTKAFLLEAIAEAEGWPKEPPKEKRTIVKAAEDEREKQAVSRLNPNLYALLLAQGAPEIDWKAIADQLRAIDKLPSAQKFNMTLLLKQLGSDHYIYSSEREEEIVPLVDAIITALIPKNLNAVLIALHSPSLTPLLKGTSFSREELLTLANGLQTHEAAQNLFPFFRKKAETLMKEVDKVEHYQQAGLYLAILGGAKGPSAAIKKKILKELNAQGMNDRLIKGGFDVGESVYKLPMTATEAEKTIFASNKDVWYLLKDHVWKIADDRSEVAKKKYGELDRWQLVLNELDALGGESEEIKAYAALYDDLQQKATPENEEKVLRQRNLWKGFVEAFPILFDLLLFQGNEIARHVAFALNLPPLANAKYRVDSTYVPYIGSRDDVKRYIKANPPPRPIQSMTNPEQTLRVDEAFRLLNQNEFMATGAVLYTLYFTEPFAIIPGGLKTDLVPKEFDLIKRALLLPNTELFLTASSLLARISAFRNGSLIAEQLVKQWPDLVAQTVNEVLAVDPAFTVVFFTQLLKAYYLYTDRRPLEVFESLQDVFPEELKIKLQNLNIDERKTFLGIAIEMDHELFLHLLTLYNTPKDLERAMELAVTTHNADLVSVMIKKIKAAGGKISIVLALKALTSPEIVGLIVDSGPSGKLGGSSFNNLYVERSDLLDERSLRSTKLFLPFIEVNDLKWLIDYGYSLEMRKMMIDYLKTIKK